MGKTALLFTGQGSQHSGMGKDFYDKFECSKFVFDEFTKITGKNIAELSFYASEEDLKLTEHSQPCILATEIAILEALKSEKNLQIDYVAGHSLGEYAALYAANVLDLKNVANLISERANCMSKVHKGIMSAILGSNKDKIQAIIQEASKFGYVDIANYNTPLQTVIAGEETAVLKANELAKQAGAKKTIILAVSGAFHSKLMLESAENFKKYVDAATISNSIIPVITNTDAKPTTLANEFKTKMKTQIYSPVKWLQTLNLLQENGVDNFIEIGPSKTLTGMVKRTLTGVKTCAITTVEELEKFLAEYKVEV